MRAALLGALAVLNGSVFATAEVECAAWCDAHTESVPNKCSRFAKCSGCTFCGMSSVCQPWCNRHPKLWKAKCAFKQCSGCQACSSDCSCSDAQPAQCPAMPDMGVVIKVPPGMDVIGDDPVYNGDCMTCCGSEGDVCAPAKTLKGVYVEQWFSFTKHGGGNIRLPDGEGLPGWDQYAAYHAKAVSGITYSVGLKDTNLDPLEPTKVDESVLDATFEALCRCPDTHYAMYFQLAGVPLEKVCASQCPPVPYGIGGCNGLGFDEFSPVKYPMCTAGKAIKAICTDESYCAKDSPLGTSLASTAGCAVHTRYKNFIDFGVRALASYFVPSEKATIAAISEATHVCATPASVANMALAAFEKVEIQYKDALGGQGLGQRWMDIMVDAGLANDAESARNVIANFHYDEISPALGYAYEFKILGVPAANLAEHLAQTVDTADWNYPTLAVLCTCPSEHSVELWADLFDFPQLCSILGHTFDSKEDCIGATGIPPPQEPLPEDEFIIIIDEPEEEPEEECDVGHTANPFTYPGDKTTKCTIPPPTELTEGTEEFRNSGRACPLVNRRSRHPTQP